MEVGNPAVAGPRTRRNKARRWSSLGARAAPPGMRASGPRSRGSQAASDHGELCGILVRKIFCFQWFVICSMRVVNPASPGRGREGTRRGRGPRWERGRPARMPRRQARLPRGCDQRPALQGLASGLNHVSYVKLWSQKTFIINKAQFVPCEPRFPRPRLENATQRTACDPPRRNRRQAICPISRL